MNEHLLHAERLRFARECETRIAPHIHRAEEPPLVKIEGRFVPGRQQRGSGQRAADQQCCIVVKDNGIGFDEKHRERIFGVFQRLHGRDAFEGTGIGLALCRKIVERHGGQITARSTPGHGSEFEILLPVAPGQEKPPY